MTREEQIAELQRQNDESRERAEERRRQREGDPYAMQDFLAAAMVTTKDAGDLHFTEPVETPPHEPAGAPYVRQPDGRGMLYRTAPENAQAPTAAAVWASEMGLDDSDALARALAEIIAATKADLRREYNRALVVRDQRIASLQRQIDELRGKLDAVNAELERANRDRAAAHALTVRLARLEGLFEGRLRSLAAFADAHGVSA
jgi:hypothetical protein